MSGIVSRIGSRSGILNQTEHDIVYSSNVPQPDENMILLDQNFYL